MVDTDPEGIELQVRILEVILGYGYIDNCNDSMSITERREQHLEFVASQ